MCNAFVPPLPQVHQCREICSGKFIFGYQQWKGISEGVKDLIRKMLVSVLRCVRV